MSQNSQQFQRMWQRTAPISVPLQSACKLLSASGVYCSVSILTTKCSTEHQCDRLQNCTGWKKTFPSMLHGAHGYHHSIHVSILSALIWNECYVGLHVGNSLQMNSSLKCCQCFVRARRYISHRQDGQSSAPNKSTADQNPHKYSECTHTSRHNIKQICVPPPPVLQRDCEFIPTDCRVH